MLRVGFHISKIDQSHRKFSRPNRKRITKLGIRFCHFDSNVTSHHRLEIIYYYQVYASQDYTGCTISSNRLDDDDEDANLRLEHITAASPEFDEPISPVFSRYSEVMHRSGEESCLLTIYPKPVIPSLQSVLISL